MYYEVGNTVRFTSGSAVIAAKIIARVDRLWDGQPGFIGETDGGTRTWGTDTEIVEVEAETTTGESIIYVDQEPNTTAAYMDGVRVRQTPDNDHGDEQQMIDDYAATHYLSERMIFSRGRVALIFRPRQQAKGSS